MIGYITIGTNDLPKAAAFYDALFAQIGAKRQMEFERGIAWGRSMDTPGYAVMKPFNDQPATSGNGTMIAIAMQKTEQVDAFYQKALELGASCDGKPGPRGGGFYAAYFRDLDGNKVNAFAMA
jgi:predicted lactoylglutathione lyase